MNDIRWKKSGTTTISAYLGKRDGEFEISYYLNDDHNWKHEFFTFDLIIEVVDF
jgi:hypothetical protein